MLTKEAINWAKLGTKAYRLATGGVYRPIKNYAARKYIASGRTNLGWKGVHGASSILGGKAGMGLGAYGVAGMVGDMTGSYDMPGSSLAMNLGIPVTGALTTLAALNRGRRAQSDEQKALMTQDIESGQHNASNDFLSSVHADGRNAYERGYYKNFLNSRGINTDGADRYNNWKPPVERGWWDRTSKAFSDPTELINDGADLEIVKRLREFEEMDKNANAKSKLASGLWGGIKNVWRKSKTPRKVAGFALGASMPVGAGYALYESQTDDKVYDEKVMTQKGYDAGQSAILKRLDSMGDWERRAASLDPTLAMRRLDQKDKGALARWQNKTGFNYEPGMLSRMADGWGDGNVGSYYQVDDFGNRQYVS